MAELIVTIKQRIPHTGGGDPHYLPMIQTPKGVFPTRVGVILLAGCGYKQNQSIPHTGGGDPYGDHTGHQVAVVFPTRVGVIPTNTMTAKGLGGIPHTGGGDPKFRRYFVD